MVTVVELRSLLRERGLFTGGLKHELEARLAEACAEAHKTEPKLAASVSSGTNSRKRKSGLITGCLITLEHGLILAQVNGRHARRMPGMHSDLR